MFKNNILYYKDVHKYIDMYYKAPNKLLKKVSEGWTLINRFKQESGPNV